jgi:pimeloyl-ACP methyl ester carboxylesterase
MPGIDIDGYRLRYREAGSGPLTVFVHGYPLDSSLWLDQLAELSSSRRCVALDLRGFGRSDPVTTDILTMERHADDVAALIEGLGEDQADVIGLSMGGYVAMAFAERHRPMLRSIGLIDTKATPDPEAVKANRDVAAVTAVVRGRAALADDMLDALLGPRASLAAKARLRSMIEGTRVETIVAALEGMKHRPNRTHVLKGLSMPAVVIVGDEDRLTPVPDAEAIADALPKARLVVIPGVGHLAPIEAPEAVNAAIAEHLAAVS